MSRSIAWVAAGLALLSASPAAVQAQAPAPAAKAAWPLDTSKAALQPYDLSTWKGMTIITGGKGYADTPWGQVHYRDIGPHTDKPPIFLMHQAPFSMTEFTAIQEELARRGYRAITVDLPGYGLSDEPKVQPTIADYARTMMAVLDVLKINKAVLVGHHTGASIAAAMAARHPERVSALIMHGVPFFTAEEGAHWLSNASQRTLKSDGSHFTDFFEIASGGPGARGKAKPLPVVQNATWAVLGYFMQGRDYGHIAAFSYDMGPDLAKITAPTLVISDPGPLLHDQDVAASKMRPNFSLFELPDVAGNSTVELAPLWTDTVVKFLDTHPAR